VLPNVHAIGLGIVKLSKRDSVQSQDVVCRDKVKRHIRLGESFEIVLNRCLASVIGHSKSKLFVGPGVQGLLVNTLELGNGLGDAGIELVERQRLGVLDRVNLLVEAARDSFAAEVDDHEDLESEGQHVGDKASGQELGQLAILVGLCKNGLERLERVPEVDDVVFVERHCRGVYEGVRSNVVMVI